MRFLHLGDLHIGKYLNDFNLIDDQRYILDQIVQIAESRRADAVMISGDVYDKSVPSEEAVVLLDLFLRRLADKKIKTFVISGNHDSDDRLSYGKSFFEREGVYIYSVFNGKMEKHTFTDENGEIDIYLLPFVKQSHVKRFFPEAEINSYEDAVKTVIECEEINPKRRNILLAHQFVIGNGAKVELAGSEGVSVQNVGTVDQISYGIFDDFDYVALGHIHSPQKIGREEVRYSGSPLKYSLSEVNNVKSVPLVTIGKKGDMEIELVPLKPRRDLRHIKGPLKSILQAENVSDPDDYIYVTLTDEDIHENAINIIRQTYPNTVKLDFENSHTREMSGESIEIAEKSKSFEELISDFYKIVYDVEISEEEMTIMREVAREAGVTDETN